MALKYSLDTQATQATLKIMLLFCIICLTVPALAVPANKITSSKLFDDLYLVHMGQNLFEPIIRPGSTFSYSARENIFYKTTPDRPFTFFGLNYLVGNHPGVITLDARPTAVIIPAKYLWNRLVLANVNDMAVMGDVDLTGIPQVTIFYIHGVEVNQAIKEMPNVVIKNLLEGETMRSAVEKFLKDQNAPLLEPIKDHQFNYKAKIKLESGSLVSPVEFFDNVGTFTQIGSENVCIKCSFLSSFNFIYKFYSNSKELLGGKNWKFDGVMINPISRLVDVHYGKVLKFMNESKGTEFEVHFSGLKSFLQRVKIIQQEIDFVVKFIEKFRFIPSDIGKFMENYQLLRDSKSGRLVKDDNFLIDKFADYVRSQYSNNLGLKGLATGKEFYFFPLGIVTSDFLTEKDIFDYLQGLNIDRSEEVAVKALFYGARMVRLHLGYIVDVDGKSWNYYQTKFNEMLDSFEAILPGLKFEWVKNFGMLLYKLDTLFPISLNAQEKKSLDLLNRVNQLSTKIGKIWYKWKNSNTMESFSLRNIQSGFGSTTEVPLPFEKPDEQLSEYYSFC